MKLQFRGDELLIDEAVRSKAELRLGLLLGRFGSEVDRVTLRLSAASVAGGPADKRCEITVELKPTSVLVEHRDTSLTVALDRAADKAVRSIARALEQRRNTKLPSTKHK